MSAHAFGIDVGGTSIRAARVDLATGQPASPIRRIATPLPAAPAAVAAVAADLLDGYDPSGAVGCALPTPLDDSTPLTATNLDQTWIGIDARAMLSAHLGRDVAVVNDADAAGLGEMRYGAGRGTRGTVLVLTFGTGVGSALFLDGRLMANTELGETPIGGFDVEGYASARVLTELGLSDEEWAGRVDEVFDLFERILRPRLIIVGGGISRRWADFRNHVRRVTPVVPAELGEHAGIVGAALAASSEAG